MLNQKRVLVTGSLGFTGRYMQAELKNHGYDVYGIGMQANTDSHYYMVDLMDKQALKQVLTKTNPDYIVHLAACAFVHQKNSHALYQINLLGTRNLLEAIAEHSKIPQCILLASSANVYGNVSVNFITEETPVMPANDYAVSKLAMEYMAKVWMKQLPIIIARPFNYTGIGQDEQFLLPKIVAHFRRKKSMIELGNLDVSRDFSDVRAVVKAYRKLIELAPINHTFNICSGHAHSLQSVIELCQSLTGHQLNVAINQDFVRHNEVKTLCGDSSKLKSVLGEWETPTLESTLTWMLSH